MASSRYVFLVVLWALVAATPVHSQRTSAADSAAIRATALDYIEGWYEGDAARMRRSLHPDLAKRIVEQQGGTRRLSHMTTDQLVNAVSRGGGRNTPLERRRTDVHIQDVYGAAASVRVDADAWVDFMHIARTDDGWKIVNVLWELRPR